MSSSKTNRSGQDVGNVVLFEHVNVTVPDLEMAALFYVHALGLTRDPYIDLGPDLMWVNAGEQQFHIPMGEIQVLRGIVDLVVPSLPSAEVRLAALAPRFDGTRFSFRTVGSHLEVTGPWGNRVRLRQASPGSGMQLGISGVEFPVRQSSIAGIARFYQEVLGAKATMDETTCTVRVGVGQALCFTATDEPIADYDGHHIAIYVADFSRPHGALVEREVVVDDIDASQYRFTSIVDPASGEQLFELEHEVRSLHHPLHRRPLVNRNADQRLDGYVPGADTFRPTGSREPSWADMQAVRAKAGG